VTFTALNSPALATVTIVGREIAMATMVAKMIRRKRFLRFSLELLSSVDLIESVINPFYLIWRRLNGCTGYPLFVGSDANRSLKDTHSV
jgi:hypothetical protein